MITYPATLALLVQLAVSYEPFEFNALLNRKGVPLCSDINGVDFIV